MNTLELVALVFCLLATGYFANRWRRLNREDADEFILEASEIRDGLPLQRWLRTLGFNFPLPSLIACAVMLMLLMIALILTLIPDHVLLATLGAVAGAGMAFFAIAELASRRIRHFEMSLIDSLQGIRANLLAGLPPGRAIEVAAGTTKGAIKAELREIARRLAMGCTAAQAVSRLLARYHCEGTRLFAQALTARYQSDNDLTAMLGSIAKLMNERIQLRMMAAGQLSGARYAAIFSGLLPYLLIPLLLRQDPKWFAPLFDQPNGIYVLGSAILLQMIGFLWLRNIVRGAE